MIDRKLVKAAKVQRYRDVEHAEAYKGRFRDGVGKVRDLIEQTFVRRHVDGWILDAGIGTGRFSVPLSWMGHPVVGVDASLPMLDAVRTELGDKIDLVKCDVELLPFRSDKFDSIVCIRVIFHLPQYKEVLAEFLRVLKPGGRLMFDVLSHEHRQLARRMAKWLRVPIPSPSTDPLDFHLSLEAKEIYQLVRNCGARCIELRSYDCLSTYWVGKVPPLKRLVRLVLRLPWLAELWAKTEVSLGPLLSPYLTARHFVVVEMPAFSSKQELG
ncbi:class I SAM-dependent methyltransferase [Nitrospinae bacterium AH_259_B05_G02_I21]|nr:class I SAM-dependent methyltransferase [Nitrospinae bacterium AH_259_B05_G02_I21]MDA2931647.1 class I SAM-dependent methyltransferase [Nitrospinae bacterium AH-259-F20]